MGLGGGGGDGSRGGGWYVVWHEWWYGDGQGKDEEYGLCMVYVVKVKAHMMRFYMMKDLNGDMAHGR